MPHLIQCWSSGPGHEAGLVVLISVGPGDCRLKFEVAVDGLKPEVAVVSDESVVGMAPEVGAGVRRQPQPVREGLPAAAALISTASATPLEYNSGLRRSASNACSAMFMPPSEAGQCARLSPVLFARAIVGTRDGPPKRDPEPAPTQCARCRRARPGAHTRAQLTLSVAELCGLIGHSSSMIRDGATGVIALLHLSCIRLPIHVVPRALSRVITAPRFRVTCG